MQVTAVNGDADNAPMRLPEVLDLAAAEGFLELMRQRLQSGRPLCIDASTVETLTLPCVQIILAAARGHDRISIKNPSNEFVSAFNDFGIDWKQYLPLRQDMGQERLQDQGQHQDQKQIYDRDGDHSPETPQQQAINDDGMRNESCHLDPRQTSEAAMMKRILTIDDSKTMRDMLMLTLADAGFDVLQAVDGQDGLDVLGKERVDIVITDINMPRMDGYEVIRRMRGNPEYKTMPILVLTTESEAQKKNLAREVGATGWMVKPFDPDQLVATVRKVAP
jgi:two-component system chemotaxis response regulator CheY